MVSAHAVRRTVEPPALVVDLDGGLVKTNLRLEALLGLIRQSPWLLLAVPFWLLKGKAYLQHQASCHACLDPTVLPYRAEFLRYLEAQRAEGRSVVLAASGEDEQIARRVASHLKLFDSVVIASERAAPGYSRVSTRVRLRDFLKPLRTHHWLKNLLLFVPLLSAHRAGNAGLAAKALLAFAAFSCLASAGYLFNDLLDLSADRRHPRKRYRSFAAGDLPLAYAVLMIPVLVIMGAATSAWISPIFLAVATTYLVLNAAYSLGAKNIALLDVIVLAGLYTLRITAGSAAVAIWPSPWLLALSTFLFFSLALVKRYSELTLNHVKARGYEPGDRELLAAMGIASGYVAVLVLALYLNSETAHALYTRYRLLWFLCPLLLYWVSHIWLSAHHGKPLEDPVVFAIRDQTSQVLFLLISLTVGCAL